MASRQIRCRIFVSGSHAEVDIFALEKNFGSSGAGSYPATSPLIADRVLGNRSEYNMKGCGIRVLSTTI